MLLFNAIRKWQKTKEYELHQKYHKEIEDELNIWVENAYWISCDNRSRIILNIGRIREIDWKYFSKLCVVPTHDYWEKTCERIEKQVKILDYLHKNIDVWYYYLIGVIDYYYVVDLINNK